MRVAALALTCYAWASADTVKPLQFGPYFVNQINMTGSPAGYDYVLTNGLYHFQVGWIEPIAASANGIFRDTYFETAANINISPFTSDLGTTVNLKPIRWLEFGLSYNRLMFHGSMVAFARKDSETVEKSLYLPANIYSADKQLSGADIFTYQGNLTFDAGPSQLFFSASRALWDIDAVGKNYVFEYGDGFLIKTRDRVNNLSAQISLDLRPMTIFSKVSFVGLAVRDQYWSTDHTSIKRNLVSAGITGFRLGQNPANHRRGLDLSLGYWTLHDQVPSGDIAKSIMIIADWQWNIHVLKI